MLSRGVACRLASACQLGSVALLGWRFAAHLPFAMLLQTLAFVAFNKVRHRVHQNHVAPRERVQHFPCSNILVTLH